MRKNWLSILMVGVLLLAACQAPVIAPEEPTTPAEQTPAAQTQAPVTLPATVLTDMTGRQVEVQGIPQRVVSLSPASTEILFALEKGASIVAVDAASDYPADTDALTKLEQGDTAGIAAAQPDIVFVGRTFPQESIDALSEQGICVVCAEAATYGEINAGIALTAQIMGAEAEKNALVQTMMESVQEVSAQASELETSPVTLVVLAYEDALTTAAGPNSIPFSLTQMAGGTPATANAITADGEKLSYTGEELAALAPEVILVSSDIDLNALCEAEGYRDLPAVQEGRIYSIDGTLMTRPGPRTAEGLREIYEALELSLWS